MKNTLITMDFDGCVSPIDPNKDFTQEPGFSIITLGNFPCAIHEDTLSFINTVQRDESIDVVWATSWEDGTEYFNKDSDGQIPSIPWIPVNLTRKNSVFNYAVDNGYRKVVIIEDSIPATTRLRKLFKDWNASNPEIGLLIVRPSLKVGLTKAHIKKILKFIDNS